MTQHARLFREGIQDTKTIRELTEKYRGRDILFQRYSIDTPIEGTISRASSLLSFVVECKDSLGEVAICNIQKIQEK